jgi:serine/threonine protein kinase/tetratricopeptide (TPR) repeat protein
VCAPRLPPDMLQHDQPRDAIEALLFECLEEDDPTSAVDQVCTDRPDIAGALRERFAMLEGIGMVEAGGGMPTSGEAFGPFTLLEELGRGGMGVVYLADQPAMNRQVALKVIRSDYLRDPRAQKRFQREIEAVSRLDHPGICTVFEAGDVDGTPFIAMRYVNGQTLARRLAAKRDVSGSETGSRAAQAERNNMLALFEKTARALHAAHEAGLVHRDVKPGNILVTDEGEPVLLDFGLAREADRSDVSITMTGDLVGTPAYMSPEQIGGRGGGGGVDRRSDVYSLGVALFEALTLRLPFAAPTREALYREILTGRTPDLRSTGLPVGHDQNLVLATAMARDPDHRYASAWDFAEDLRRARRLEPIAARRPGLAGRTWRWARREPVKASLSAVLLALLAGSSGLLGYIVSQKDAVAVGALSIEQRDFERELARAAVETKMGDYGRARLHLDAAGVIRPRNLQVLFGRVRVDVLSGEYDRAIERLDTCGESPANVTKLRAHVLRERGDIEAAERVLATLESDATTVGTADELILEARLRLLRWRPRMYRNDVEGADAAAAFQLVLRAILKSQNAQLHHYLYLADAAHKSNHASHRAYCAESLLALFPDEPLALTAAADCTRRSDPRGALQIGLRVRRDWPECTVVLDVLCNIYRALGDPDRALECLRELARLDGKRRRSTLSMLGVILVARGELGAAEETVRGALETWPDAPGLIANLADILMRRGRVEESRRQFERAIAISKREEPEYLAGYGDLLQMTGEFELAEKNLRRAIELDPQGGAGQFSLGKLLFKTRRFEAALAAFDRARTLNSNFVDAHLRHARTALGMKKLDVAKRSFQRALELRADVHYVHYALGWIAQQQRDIEAAKQHYGAVTPQDPNYPHAMCNLAWILARTGDAAAALPLMRKGHAAGSKDKNWKFPSGEWIRQVEKMKTQQAEHARKR